MRTTANFIDVDIDVKPVMILRHIKKNFGPTSRDSVLGCNPGFFGFVLVFFFICRCCCNYKRRKKRHPKMEFQSSDQLIKVILRYDEPL